MNLNAFIKPQALAKEFESFFRAYIEALYFTETGDDGQPESDAELTDDSLRAAYKDCRKFFNVYSDLFKDQTEQAGHDFWFTRNGHGVGFWDRPEEIYGDCSEELTRACNAFGESYPDFEGD